MKTQIVTAEYAEHWPLQPWAAVVQTAAGTGVADVTDMAEHADAPGWAPSAGPAGSGSGAARRQRDRGASAVEWVVITAIVVAIVGVVGGIIYNALKDKANTTKTDIQNVNVSNNPTGL